MRIVVHGGAGPASDEPVARQAVLDEAAEQGAAASSPVEAVERAIRVLESSPRFNAGLGGAIQSDAVVRTDAGLMTDDGAAGAICGVPGIEHPVSLARVVYEDTPHVLMTAPGAVELAEANGIETGVDLTTEDSRARWESIGPVPDAFDERLAFIRQVYGTVPDDADHDTVGAVATDGSRLAAATSTDGRWMALAGRIGDTPQIGAGFFAHPAGGASATGAGEAIATVGLTRRAVDHLAAGLGAQSAADRVIDQLADATGETAGVIVLAPDGSIGTANNTEAMQTATASD
jgi:isoaspartyl peptidase/L-asparaginase-like protein (Ntn-hydrolase superfamily)